MKAAIAIVHLLATLVLLTGLALADEPLADKVSYVNLDLGGRADAGSAGRARPAGLALDDAQMDLRKSDFVRFAQAKLQEMNRNHRLARERMQIVKNPDGSYRAVFHEIDDASLACEVSRSQSKTIPYVAVLSYKEQIYATTCLTPDDCRRGDFTPVEVIPNRHIFSYSKGGWQ